MKPTLEQVANRFAQAKQVSASQWEARCPCHDDRNASLSIGQGDNGGIVLHCHAGCATADVLACVELTLADLMPDQVSPHKANGKKQRGKVASIYDYRDESGNLLYQSLRYDPKDFQQRAPDGNGGWKWSTKGIRRVLYRLPELIAADPEQTIFVVEGEKDVDRLASLGILATTNVGGAGKWRDEYSDALAGRKIVLTPDNDSAGKAHLQTAARKSHGKAAIVRWLELPGLPPKGDVSDWLNAGNSAELLLELADSAPIWTPPPERAATPIVAAPAPAVTEAEGRTELSNARRFVVAHAADVRYVPEWGKWLTWTGQRWQIDAGCDVAALAKSVPAQVWQDVTAALPNAPSARDATEMLSFAKATASARGIEHLLTLARSEPGIPIDVTALDRDPWAFNVANGTIDLRMGELRAHERTDYLTKLCPHAYSPHADAPFWLATVHKIFAGNSALIGFFRRLCGSAMAGEVIDHILPIFWGSGGNGKTLVIETLLAAMGSDYADHGAAEMLLASDGDRHPTEKADLHGKRLIVCAETEDGRRLAEGTVKRLTGSDTVKARRMREDFWSFKPTHTLVLATNNKPIVRGTDEGIWRRLRLVPFAQRFWDAGKGETGPPELQADPHLQEKLRPELPGIVHWLVDACREWQEHGLGQPDEVTAATADYRESQDVLAGFWDECCSRKDGCTVKAADVRQRYEDWCKVNGEKPVSGRRFGDYITGKGVTRRKSNVILYEGLGIK